MIAALAALLVGGVKICNNLEGQTAAVTAGSFVFSKLGTGFTFDQ
jgi:hypothetical protein